MIPNETRRAVRRIRRVTAWHAGPRLRCLLPLALGIIVPGLLAEPVSAQDTGSADELQRVVDEQQKQLDDMQKNLDEQLKLLQW